MSGENKPAKRKSNGKNSPVIGNNGFKLEPGDNSKVIADMMYIYKMPPIDLDSNEEVANRIDEYFEYCIGRDIRPGVEGMSMAIGIDRRTLWEWETGRKRGTVDSSRADLIKKAKQILAMYMENLSQSGKLNPVTGIFLMKNHFGYKDEQEINVSAKQPLGDELSPEEIQKRVELAQDDTIDVDFNED